jgi:integrase
VTDLEGIDQRPNGTFRVRYSERRRRRSKHFKTEDEAVRFRDAVRRATAKIEAPVLGMSVQQASHSFLAKRKHLRDHRSDVSRWRRHIEGTRLAAMDVSLVTRRDVLDWRDELDQALTQHRWGKRPVVLVSRSTKKHALNLLRRFLEYCVDRELLGANPARGVRIEEESAPIPDEWYLTPEEVERLYDDKLGAERWIALFAIGTGLRQSEQWSLRLVDVHVDGDNPHVFVRFGYEGRTPKNKKPRVVPLFGIGLAAAKAWLELVRLYAKKNPKGLMFPTKRGARRGRCKVPRSWPKLREAIGRHVHWHLLRHTFASSLVAGWWGRAWSLEEVRTFMGHSSITVTERYAHLAKSRAHDIAREAQEAWTTARAKDQARLTNQQENPSGGDRG